MSLAGAYLGIPTTLYGIKFLTAYSRVLENFKICFFYPKICMFFIKINKFFLLVKVI